MRKLSAEEVLSSFTDLAPYINSVTAEDMGISVIKGDRYVAYLPAETLDLGIKVGDPIKSPAVQRCLDTGKRIVQTFTRETSKFGVPYVACALPIKEGDQVVGCVVTTQTIATQEKVNAIAVDLAAATEELNAGMEEITSRAAGLSSTSRELEHLSKELAGATRKTDEIVSFISNVASQTNLLGLNAAIEAARVGEQGRGFGVVADEVRKLAVASSDSVKSITDSLDGIQRFIVSLTEKIGAIDKNLVEQSSSVQEMSHASQALAEMAAELSAVSEGMYKNEI